MRDCSASHRVRGGAQRPRKIFSTYHLPASKSHLDSKKTMKLTTFSVAFASFAVATVFSQAAAPAPASTAVNCTPVAKNTASLVAKNKSKVLEIVSSQVAANSACACEIVKTAIKTSKADKATVAAIVEAAIVAAPDQIRIIAQCAIAAAPDAAAEIMAVVERLSPGDKTAYSSKDSGDITSSKSPSAKARPHVDVAAIPNVLDFPDFGPISPFPGSPGGGWLIPIFPPLPPQPVTNVNP